MCEILIRMSIGNKSVNLLFAVLACVLFLAPTTKAQSGTWAIGFGGNLQEYAEDIAVDDVGNIYISVFVRFVW